MGSTSCSRVQAEHSGPEGDEPKLSGPRLVAIVAHPTGTTMRMIARPTASVHQLVFPGWVAAQPVCEDSWP